MCGRFALSIVAARMPELLGVEAPEGYRPRWNVTPDSPILILRAGPAGREAALPRWGFLGPWSSDPKDPGRQINARIETAAQKPMFKAAAVKGRCLVPADGFYEWQKQPQGPSRPFFVRATAGRPLLMAGLWRRNRLADGSLLETAAILTRDASPALAPIHHRMPVLLPPRLVEAWLLAEPAPVLLRELAEGVADAPEVEAVEVGRAVNDPRKDGPELVEPAGGGDRPAARLP
jgi:putative SOS response-associated peptidase YedK